MGARVGGGPADGRRSSRRLGELLATSVHVVLVTGLKPSWLFVEERVKLLVGRVLAIPDVSLARS